MPGPGKRPRYLKGVQYVLLSKRFKMWDKNLVLLLEEGRDVSHWTPSLTKVRRYDLENTFYVFRLQRCDEVENLKVVNGRNTIKVAISVWIRGPPVEM